MEREKSGVFQLEDTFPKTGQTVLEVLHSKHPEACPLTSRSQEAYGGKPPAMVPEDITDVTVATVTRKLLGSAGKEGVDSISLKHWLMQFGVACLGIRKTVGFLGYWMANGCPLWAAYRALVLGRLISLDKCPGVRIVVMGET